MSKKREAINRYRIIINRLRRNPAGFEEILNELQLESEIHSYNYAVSKRTFKRDLEDIYSIYGIDIQFDFSANVYRIVDEANDDSNHRLLEAFDTFNALKVTRRLPQYIHFESRCARGTENMSGLLHAIQNNLRITFTYFKYWSGSSELRHVEPLALKESINRWYVVAHDLDKNAIRIFGLDRLSELDFTGEKFRRPKGFNVKELFKHSFGIITGIQNEPEEIVLTFKKPQAEYIKSLPLHHSQKIVGETNNEIQLSLKLLITEDLIQEILSHGDRITVIQPQKLVDEITQICSKVMEKYSPTGNTAQ
ncbi:WYL domain-containing protein [Marinilabiliaceae bacterium ANBcel2]|nr:WYL domain-containing protein [Marinilabiliaceae bacterium ANBcel2]